MKTVLASASLALLLGSPAIAVEFQSPVTKQLYTCAKPGLSRIAMTTHPAPCCDGQLKCAQFLSTTGILHTSRDPRT